jgi:hypothetical protein
MDDEYWALVEEATVDVILFVELVAKSGSGRV